MAKQKIVWESDNGMEYPTEAEALKADNLNKLLNFIYSEVFYASHRSIVQTFMEEYSEQVYHFLKEIYGEEQ